MKSSIELSPLGHTWILDLDGTIVKHNGYKTEGEDSFVDGAKEFLLGIPLKDMIVFITSREQSCKEKTELFLKSNNIRYDHIIYGAPCGERILINDSKPSGLNTAISICKKRDERFTVIVKEDCSL